MHTDMEVEKRMVCLIRMPTSNPVIQDCACMGVVKGAGDKAGEISRGRLLS